MIWTKSDQQNVLSGKAITATLFPEVLWVCITHTKQLFSGSPLRYFTEHLFSGPPLRYFTEHLFFGILWGILLSTSFPGVLSGNLLSNSFPAKWQIISYGHQTVLKRFQVVVHEFAGDALTTETHVWQLHNPSWHIEYHVHAIDSIYCC